METSNQNLIQQNELLSNQNKLLIQINELLLRQNQLLQPKSELPSAPPRVRESFIENIDRDEMRNGFLVTSPKKRLWNVQIGIINEFARICKKHNIKWFAFYGTLLGAARHKGFIPWDDDTDVAMLRSDYDKLKKVITGEIQYPYHLANWCDYRHEADGNNLSEYEKTLPLITLRQTRECPMWWPCRTMLRMTDQRTTALNFDARKHLYTGIWLDIFVLDAAPPFPDKDQSLKFELAKELFWATIYPDSIRSLMKNNKKLVLEYSDMNKFLGMSYRRKTMYLDKFLSESFSDAQFVTEFRGQFLESERAKIFSAENFNDIIYLPFEKIEIPVPAGWKNILEIQYGDWQKMMITHTHTADYSVDIPYTEYRKQSGL